MPLLQFIPIRLTFALALGIFLGYHLQINPWISISVIILCLMVMSPRLEIRYSKRGTLFGWLALLACCFLGILSVSLAAPSNQPNHFSHRLEAKEQYWQMRIREVLRPSDYQSSYIADVISVDGTYGRGKMLLSLPPLPSMRLLRAGDLIVAHGQSKVIKPPPNPHGFDYSSYMESLGVNRQLKLGKGKFALQPPLHQGIKEKASDLREDIGNALKQSGMAEEARSVVQALLLGQRKQLDKEIYEQYKDAGAVHILAVSGLHIGILLFFLQWILKPLDRIPYGKESRLTILVVLLWGYALLAGFSASVVRAVSMFSFVAYALYLKRPSNSFNILALSMFFILLVIDAKLLFQAGFQLSYTAVLSIVWIYPKLDKVLAGRNRFVRKVWQIFSLSLAAQLGVLPISLYYFHQFPGLFFLSNLLIIPVLGIILGMGFLLMFLALLGSLPQLLLYLFEGSVLLMNRAVAFIAGQEMFVFRDITFDLTDLFLSFLLIWALVVSLSTKKAKLFLIVFLLYQSLGMLRHYQQSRDNSLVVLHQNRQSLVVHKRGHTADVYTDLNNIRDSIILPGDYFLGERIASYQLAALPKYLEFDTHRFLVADSLDSRPFSINKGDTVKLLLRQSPRVNLDRWLEDLKPSLVVADGSNYHSYVRRWERSCERMAIPFHYTGDAGALVLNADQ